MCVKVTYKVCGTIETLVISYLITAALLGLITLRSAVLHSRCQRPETDTAQHGSCKALVLSLPL